MAALPVAGSAAVPAPFCHYSFSRRSLGFPLPPGCPCSRLLAKLVLVREEVQQSLVEAAFLAGGAPEGSPEAAAFRAPFRQLAAVPKADAAFVQRLVALDGEAER